MAAGGPSAEERGYCRFLELFLVEFRGPFGAEPPPPSSSSSAASPSSAAGGAEGDPGHADEAAAGCEGEQAEEAGPASKGERCLLSSSLHQPPPLRRKRMWECVDRVCLSSGVPGLIADCKE
uniref:Uncharacterized protein n=1 Tax=Sphaerodactylus townsendi TaxID=933632 RepID=A0ACB8ED77_9SAUR